ncbi:MAG: UDP-N-acetylmuramoyl-L-alanyl-D-glutamate--2,6-diaminopimelate ligase [Gammaproteobacteria bacterium]|nr:MAG: UDP-N-acetylmuramoyl-L-alanyl-D-glutamate--2,6-diaminopimelate ligase [Gammaproteobacteria bacterium]
MMAAESNLSGLSLAWLLEGLCIDGAVADNDISGLATDSRSVRPGDLFLAGQGLRVHGLSHVEQALQRGAVAVAWEPVADSHLNRIATTLAVPAVAVAGLAQKTGVIADRFYAHPSRELRVIGVTGTDGKTSVSHFIAQALSTEQQPCGLLGTLGYGVYGALQTPTHTTPDALRLHAEFAELRDQGVKNVAMEVSSHALHQHRTAGVDFNTAVLTHLSRDHLDYHGSIEAYAEAKRRLFENADLGCAVVNVTDDFGRQLAADLKHSLRVIAWQGRPGGVARSYPDWIELKNVRALEKGIALELDSSWGAATFETALLGGFNAENLLAALGALLASGLSLQAAVERLARVTTVAGRMELFSRPGAPRVVVDYAHTPHALETVLQALRPHCAGELVCVFGAGGDRDQGKRPQMGALAERYADRVVLTSDNPRSENPDSIVDQIVQGFEQPQRAVRIGNRGTAIASAIREAAADDLVLVAGKGHEDYQQTGSQRLVFSDRVRVQEVLRELGE